MFFAHLCKTESGPCLDHCKERDDVLLEFLFRVNWERLVFTCHQVLDDSKKWWKVQNRYSQVGYVPFNILSLTVPELGDYGSALNDNKPAQINGPKVLVRFMLGSGGGGG